MNARAEILASVRSAIADLPAGSGEVPRNYAFTLPMTDVLGTFVQRVADYRAEVERVPADELAQRITAAVAGWGGGTVVVPPDLDAGWVEAIAAAADVGSDVPPLTLDELDHSAGVVTSAALGIALTGTLVLDAGVGMGRRALSLVPDRHLCIIRAVDVVASVPEAIRRIDPTRPVTFISGPSATSDIELSRVEGVHGPRTLHVIVVE